MKKVKIKKQFLLIEVLIAITLLSLCLLPFIPKSNMTFLNFKKNAALTCVGAHFEEKICQMRERAYQEGFSWVKETKPKQTVFSQKEKVCFDELKLCGEVVFALTLDKVMESKNSGKNLYRFKLNAKYLFKELKKKEVLYAYLTLEI